MRVSKAGQAYFYVCMLLFLVLSVHMIQSCFTGSLPFGDFYYFVLVLILIPSQVLVFSVFYKDYGYDYLYRIFGHYRFNFSFKLVQSEFLLLDTLNAIFDFAVVYLPFELVYYQNPISLVDKSPVSDRAYQCYQTILFQMIFFHYLNMSNVQVKYAFNIILILTIIGIATIFDDDYLVGTTQLFTSPQLLLSLLFQIILLSVKNQLIHVFTKVVIRRYADMLQWYSNIEDKLSYEEYEDPN